MSYELLHKPWLPGGGGVGRLPYERGGDARRLAQGV